jgi:cell filamentation protein
MTDKKAGEETLFDVPDNIFPKLKYTVPHTEDNSDVLPNLLNIQTVEEINKAEFEGFLRAERLLVETLAIDTDFNNKFIKKIHKLALQHLYNFAGKYRTVNLLKDNFLFPPAQFLNENMGDFEKNILNKVKTIYVDKKELIKDISTVHAEFLFIHPFREGNGRTARILANLMAYKAGFKRLKFEKIITQEKFDFYVKAVQRAGLKDYSLMEKVISEIF